MSVGMWNNELVSQGQRGIPQGHIVWPAQKKEKVLPGCRRSFILWGCHVNALTRHHFLSSQMEDAELIFGMKMLLGTKVSDTKVIWVLTQNEGSETKRTPWFSHLK